MLHRSVSVQGRNGARASYEKRRVALYVAMLAGDLMLIAGAVALSGGLYIGIFGHQITLTLTQLFLPIYTVLALYNATFSTRALTHLGFASSRALLSLGLSFVFIIFAGFYMAASESLSRAVLTIGVVVAGAALVGFRFVLHRIVVPQVLPDLDSIVVFLDGGPAVDLPDALIVDVAREAFEPRLDDPAALDRFGSLAHHADRVIISCPYDRRKVWTQIMRAAGVNGELVSDSLLELRPLGLRSEGGFVSLVVSSRPLGFRARVIKRAMDTALAGLAVLALSPIFALVALAIKLEDRGPVFFVQRRMGRGNTFFDMLKFRSMRVENSDSDGNRSASKDDDRITRVGHILRRTSLDELPQLINVLRGEMSLVGPRPHALGSLAGRKLFWEVEGDYWHRHSLKPGLTGLAQIRGLRGATDREEHLSQRLAADLEYIATWSPWHDLKIMLMTVRVLVHDRAF